MMEPVSPTSYALAGRFLPLVPPEKPMFPYAAAAAKLLQSCLTLCDPIAHQAPLSMGILQARRLEWVAVQSSRGSSRPRN